VTIQSRADGNVHHQIVAVRCLRSAGASTTEDAGLPYDIERYGLDVKFDPADQKSQAPRDPFVLVNIRPEACRHR